MSIDLSLSRLHQLLPHLPLQYTRPTIHIAGTNGKGSVSALVASILAECSSSSTPLSIGRFNSPHLVHITDCIIINDQPVSEESYEVIRAAVLKADEQHGTKLTPFEVLALTALQIFEQAAVDIVVMEVGMGGRLDATNVISTECILVSALTSVDLDHQGFLGDTVGAIATEKAGIARRGKPFVLGPQSANNRDAVQRAVESRIGEVGARLCESVKVIAIEKDSEDVEFASGEFRPHKGTTIEAFIPALSSTPIHTIFPLHGLHQLENLSTSLGIVQALLSLDDPRLDFRKIVTLDAVERGITNVRWRGRLSWHEYTAQGRRVPVLVDGAHNPASSRTLRAYLDSVLSSSSLKGKRVHITYILALSHSPPKKPRDTLESLFTPTPETTSCPPLSISVAFVPFTPPTNMPWVKPVPPAQLALSVRDLSSSECVPQIWTPSPDVALGEGEENVCLKEALDWSVRFQKNGTSWDAEEVQELIVVAGSLYLVADFYRLVENLEVMSS